jgi:hypothetical protein
MRKLFWILVACLVLTITGCCGSDDDVYIPGPHDQGGGDTL